MIYFIQVGERELPGANFRQRENPATAREFHSLGKMLLLKMATAVDALASYEPEIRLDHEVEYC